MDLQRMFGIRSLVLTLSLLVAGLGVVKADSGFYYAASVGGFEYNSPVEDWVQLGRDYAAFRGYVMDESASYQYFASSNVESPEGFSLNGIGPDAPWSVIRRVGSSKTLISFRPKISYCHPNFPPELVELYGYSLEACTEGDNDDSGKNHGCTGPNGAGNPCNVATGNKYQSETDFLTGGMAFTRSYNSQNLANLGFGTGWRSNYQQKLIISNNALTSVSRTGRGEAWQKINGIWYGDEDSDVSVSENASGFQVNRANGVIEQYTHTGYLRSITDPNGHDTEYNYDSRSRLNEVVVQYGHRLTFTYTGNKVTAVSDVNGAIYRYEYDSNDNLVSVVYPDSTENDLSDNPRKTYHYENANFPNHLTGITDENGDRFATWAYDANGKAISSQHGQTTNAAGQERFELNYQGAN